MSASKRASIKSKSPLDAFIGSKPIETDTEASVIDAQAAPTNEETADQPGQDLRQTTIMAYDEQLDWLDEKCIEARKRKGKHRGPAIRKAAIIRALIDLARSAPVDLSGLQSEEELVHRFEQAIKSK
jgi:hypothetical protein